VGRGSEPPTGKALKPGEVFNPYRRFTGVFIAEALVRLPPSKLSAGAKLCYGRLARYAGEDGACYPAVKTIAKELGVGKRQAQRYLKELKECKFIEVVARLKTPREWDTNDYRFLWHPIFDEMPLKRMADYHLMAESPSPPPGDPYVTTYVPNPTAPLVPDPPAPLVPDRSELVGTSLSPKGSQFKESPVQDGQFEEKKNPASSFVEQGEETSNRPTTTAGALRQNQNPKAKNVRWTPEQIQQLCKALGEQRRRTPPETKYVVENILCHFETWEQVVEWFRDMATSIKAEKVTGKYGIYAKDAETFMAGKQEQQKAQERANKEEREAQEKRAAQHAAECPGFKVSYRSALLPRPLRPGAADAAARPAARRAALSGLAKR
jgi:hypothetical protein